MSKPGVEKHRKPVAPRMRPLEDPSDEALALALEPPEPAPGDDTDSSPDQSFIRPPAGTRRVVAVGDLHGDYHRLIRILDEHALIGHDPLSWDPEARGVDLVLIGDYVDWRGEPLEGPEEEWILGIERLIRLIMRMVDDARFLSRRDGFDCRIFPLLGNHDQMMLDSADVFEFLTLDQIEEVVEARQKGLNLTRLLSRLELTPANMDTMLRFFNWYNQGGDATCASFGSLEAWRDAMEGAVGDFFRNQLLLGVVLNNRLYAHSLPDDPEFWRPLDEILAFSSERFRQAREAFIWGRRIWGYDAFSGRRCRQPEDQEMDVLLAGFGVEGAVVGHTPFRSIGPTKAYQGRIINIDSHGIPGSFPYIEEYPAPPGANRNHVPGNHRVEEPEPDSPEAAASETGDPADPVDVGGAK